MDSAISPFESPKSLRAGSVGGSDWGPKASERICLDGEMVEMVNGFLQLPSWTHRNDVFRQGSILNRRQAVCNSLSASGFHIVRDSKNRRISCHTQLTL